MRDNRPSGSEGGVESHISIPTPIYSTRALRHASSARSGMCAPGSMLEREGASPSLAELPANNGK